jgi:hypothetical protein
MVIGLKTIAITINDFKDFQLIIKKIQSKLRRQICIAITERNVDEEKKQKKLLSYYFFSIVALFFLIFKNYVIVFYIMAFFHL